MIGSSSSRSLLRRLIAPAEERRDPPGPLPSRYPDAQAELATAAHDQFDLPDSHSTLGTSRKELLRLILRRTLQENGIPLHWIKAEALVATASGREPGIHVRFLICHWEPRLLQYCATFQRQFRNALLVTDPLARNWLMGFSWQFALPRDTTFPPMPEPGFWDCFTQTQPGLGSD